MRYGSGLPLSLNTTEGLTFASATIQACLDFRYTGTRQTALRVAQPKEIHRISLSSKDQAQ